ncbi:MAG: HD-GYP domain-containing protein [Lachnospiraceae bacterium]|nr:HD-GYP domain-containing protein [Lachnospiraceae bacterium]
MGFNLEYNFYLELAVIPLDIILFLFLNIRYKKKTQVNNALKLFAFFVMVATTVDVATAIVTSAHNLVPNWVHYIFNTADSMLASATGIAFIRYIWAYVKNSEFKLRYVLTQILLIINYGLLLTNPFTHLVFSYDENGNYIHEKLFTLVAYVFPIVFFLIGCVYMYVHWKNYKKSQVTTMTIAIILTATLFLLQMLFFDTFLITFFVASLGVLVIYLSLESPDYERLIETMEQLRESQSREAAVVAKERLSKEIMIALSQAVDAKDHYTKGHSIRVAEYARAIAEQMGKSEEECEEIYYMGLLHDVGKIGVPEDILNKNGRLTDEEFGEIKKHTVTGYDILHTITEIPGISTGARWHHERYDGKGYPDGLPGSEIPEEARIICVADCYDAMTSKRVYSTPKTQEEVRSEIIRCKGTQFDPDVADAMIAIIDRDKEYSLREAV